ncbi:MAG: hypothetical protein QCI38_01885, partial [Candidatus Thermoplasmatota archaeon]|nr:hypothetical protein [Candidatus Thermoplasmatota archaeon]
MTERMGAYLFLSSWAITVLSTMAGLLLLFWSLFYVIEPLSNSTQWLFIAIPFIIPIASLSGAALSAYYVLLAATIFLSIAYVAKR